MPDTRSPVREQSLQPNGSATTPWEVLLKRLEKHEPQQTAWLSTVRPDGRPHLMPIIAFWMEDALLFIAREGTQKGRNLAADGRCAIATGSTVLPSIDIIAEGRAAPIDDPEAVRRLAEAFGSDGWPLQANGVEVSGPHAPTAGPPPYRIYRMAPDTVFGLPGMLGMDQFDPEELPKPTRWEFAAD